MSEKSRTISVCECRVSFLCKICGVLFQCVSTYCTHKVENHHSIEFLHNKSLVFEESESIFKANENEHGPGFDTVAADEWQTTPVPVPVPLNISVLKEVKKEPFPADAVIINYDDDTVTFTANSSIITNVNLVPFPKDKTESNHNSDVKTEWVEDTLVIYETPSKIQNPLCRPNFANTLQENVNSYEKLNYYDGNETQSSFSRFDADADADMDPTTKSHVQVSDGAGPDPLEKFNMTQSNQLTSTLTTSEMEQKYFNKIKGDSDDDIICLDDSPPSTPNKIASSTGPTPTANSASNSFILSQFQLKFQCQLCSKHFTSNTQLGIHVSICELYNGKIEESAVAAGGSSSQPQAVRSRIRNRSQNRSHGRVKTKGGCSQRNNYIDCQECFIKVRRSNLKSHLETEHKIFVEDSDRKYVCHSCGSAFPVKNHLNRHARVHSDERPFICSFPLCSYAFKNENSLQNHLLSHPPQVI